MGMLADLKNAFSNYDSSIGKQEPIEEVRKCYKDIISIRNRPRFGNSLEKERIRILGVLESINRNLNENPLAKREVNAKDAYQKQLESIEGFENRLKEVKDDFLQYEKRYYKKVKHQSRLYLDKKVNSIRKQIILLLEDFKFEDADDVCFEDNDPKFVGEEWYKKERDEYYTIYKTDSEKKKFEAQQESIIIAFKNFDFDFAKSIFDEAKYLDKSEYDKLEQEAFDRVPSAIWNAAIDSNLNAIEKLMSSYKHGQRAKERFEQYIRIIEYLRLYEFSKADDAYEKLNNKPTSYIQLKAEMICEYLEKKGLGIDEEKGLALGDTSKYILLKARAGSGKTRAVTCKAVLLCEKYGLSPDEIMILAFNTDAAEEINNRVKKKVCNFNHGRTYHAFALSILSPPEDIIKGKQLSNFIEDIIKKRMETDTNFLLTTYNVFRQEMEIPEEDKSLDERYEILRGGEFHDCLEDIKVKSMGEKYISDFFFEHGISAMYEKKYTWKGRAYKPDFTVAQEGMGTFIIEHWGIDEFDKDKNVAANWNKTWDEYYKEMQDKRAYWKNRPEILIETSICDMQKGRAFFEKSLKRKLEEYNFCSTKLSEEELLKKFGKIHNKKIKLFRLFEQFIQKAKKKALTTKDLKNEIDNYLYSLSGNNNRQNFFLKCAYEIFTDYQGACERERKIDYDDAIMQATNKMREYPNQCFAFKQSVRDFKYVLMDEYQDFSKLFSNMIQAWRECNPELKVFCVGDNWQAINGFAGSDLKYFDKVEEEFKGVSKRELLTNYRSSQSVVKVSNKLMTANNGESEAKYHDDAEYGEVTIKYVSDVWIEGRDEKKGAEAYLNDKKYTFNGDSGFMVARYLKVCHEIINDNPNKTIGIISRTNKILHKVGNFDFRKRLLEECLTSEQEKFLGGNLEDCEEERLKVDTAHKFKGLERDVTIIIAANEKNFPTIRSADNELFGFFGVTDDSVLKEERRLFYVALSRAKEKVYILTEKDEESRFLKDIGIIGEN